MSSADVWQQLHEFRLGGPLNQLVELIVGLPNKWETHIAVTTQETIASSTTTLVATTTTALPNMGGQAAVTSSSSSSSSEGLQLFGLFASRYFVFGLAVGFAISRIHVLVRRQRVRPVGAVARVAIYAPVHALLLRTLVRACVALDSNDTPTGRWMAGPVGRMAQEARQWGVGPVTAAQAVWEAFFASCIFDCIDVFVARLEGSPCAPYEYIGSVVERMSLYYFYGASMRIHELALLSVIEKLMLSHVLVAVPSGWQWRLLPTAVANMLLLHHFVFSMRHFVSLPQSMYPFVQVLSMALLAVSLAIVMVTVAVRWLATTVDRLGISSRPTRHASARPVAVYRSGEFQGITDDADDDALYELDQNTLPLTPDLRRDFSVEILDLASTCLKQHSSNIRTSGFTRICGVIRRPRTTALDEYIDSVIQPSPYTGAVDTPPKGVRGMSVFIDDEPGIADMLPASSMDLATVLQDTRIDSICKLSAGLWALMTALFLYATKTKQGQLSRELVPRQSQRHRQRTTHGDDGWRRASDSAPESSAGIRGYVSSDNDSDDEGDYDYVCTASVTGGSSEDEDSIEDEDSEGSGELVSETAALVGEILSDVQPDGNEALASAVTFIAHSIYGPGFAMTRAMYARHMAHSGQIPRMLPFSRSETESLATLIRSKRPAADPVSEDGVFCVVCWKSPRCVMLRPCRCLCLCNECRSALALRNFDHCPCCRRSVIGYSRVYAV